MDEIQQKIELKKIGLRIKQLIKQTTSCSIEAWCWENDFNRNVVQNYVTGKCNPTIKSLMRIIDNFKIETLEEFFTLELDKTHKKELDNFIDNLKSKK